MKTKNFVIYNITNITMNTHKKQKPNHILFSVHAGHSGYDCHIKKEIEIHKDKLNDVDIMQFIDSVLMKFLTDEQQVKAEKKEESFEDTFKNHREFIRRLGS